MIVHLALNDVLEGALGLGLDIVGASQRLVRAKLAPSPCSTRALAQRVVSVDGGPVTSLLGRAVAIDGAFEPAALGPGDVVVVPGVFTPTLGAVDRALARPDVVAALTGLQAAHARGAWIAASCSATFFLGAAGLLDGGSATTTWWLIPAFKRRFPTVELRADRMVVESGATLTAGAAFAHADLVLAVVSRLASPALGHLAARYLVLDERPAQGRYMVLDHLSTYDPALKRVEELVVANLGRQIGLDELARAACMSPRTLARRVQGSVGLSPQRFVQRIRVAHAAHLLETTRASVEEVAERVGYADPAAFRRAYRRHLGAAPRGRRRGEEPT